MPKMNKVVLFKKIIKFTFILALVSFLTRKTVKCLQNYLENPTYTTNRYVNQDETDFPAMTICPIYGKGYRKSKLKKYGIDEDNYCKYSTCHSNISWSSSAIANISELDLFDKVTYQFNELVNKIHVGHINSIHVSFQVKHA